MCFYFILDFQYSFYYPSPYGHLCFLSVVFLMDSLLRTDIISSL